MKCVCQLSQPVWDDHMYVVHKLDHYQSCTVSHQCIYRVRHTILIPVWHPGKYLYKGFSTFWNEYWSCCVLSAKRTDGLYRIPNEICDTVYRTVYFIRYTSLILQTIKKLQELYFVCFGFGHLAMRSILSAMCDATPCAFPDISVTSQVMHSRIF